MSIRIATFNMENLFSRPRALNLEHLSDGKPIIEKIAKLIVILEKETYSASDKKFIKDAIESYGPTQKAEDRFFEINEIRGSLYKKKTIGNKTVAVVEADGRADWVGWVVFVKDEVKFAATENTARVVQAVNADVLLAVEAEDRSTLGFFNDQVLADFSTSYAYNLLVDGNDQRGIDIGIYSRFPIVSVRSHVFDTDGQGVIFSRDCPEFEIALPGGDSLWILGNHWKSKANGSLPETTARRVRQAKRVNAIYREAAMRSDFVVIAGDLNDTPSSSPLIELRKNGVNIKDVMDHPAHTGQPGSKPGTYGSGNTVNMKIDYLFLSPVLWSKVEMVGVERGGIFAPVAGNPFPTVTSKLNQASDHAAVWVDLDV
jgi:endonuclease/exonuclease/phosphatase family metal-dependent hydrolase